MTQVVSLEIAIQNKVSQKEKDKYLKISLICEIQKNDTDELICKAEIDTQTQRTNLWIPRGQEKWDELGDQDWQVESDSL